MPEEFAIPEDHEPIERTPEEWTREGDKHARANSWYSAEACYKLAGNESKRKELVRKSLFGTDIAKPNPTRSWLLAMGMNDKKLLKQIMEKADKDKLELLREQIKKDL